ncbi:hypothetical protein HanRHA438_Chr00c03g0844881 [Helianthus annuus]|nr:hypothetical protein HanRHA438_Chr00c03g0844881 [Helianthus annuus]
MLRIQKMILIPKDAPERCYQIQKMLQIRLKMFDVEDDVLDDGSMLKMIQKMFDVEHDVSDLKDPPDPLVCMFSVFFFRFAIFCVL